MKKILILFLLINLLTINSVLGKATIEIPPQNRPPSVMELAFLRELGPSILKAMSTHGQLQLFTSERIEKIERNIENDYYDISVRVAGYEGAINPPYKLIRITFRVPGKDYKNELDVISYKATDITPEEFVKLSEFAR
ncbi:DUF3888 domain-containing protein [Lysinibacillus yapensis]|uniref:DUF3888 domain-containing protein n=1 Tax=Ureibacillus yapensis TaxID=2304605 RepID=A0A396S539_9BACL|nr:DUF3888 domain-containing protein [Lysinibacillus yapensis]RHW34100.1 DUF3888 domain-containing protein [Lysinibacillus yapensis]